MGSYQIRLSKYPLSDPCSPHNNAEKSYQDLGHDETPNSRNRAFYNDKVSKVVLDNAPRNAKYTSYIIQKEILHILANKVHHKIPKDIGNSKFCIIIYEARDESKREQMTIILRYVDEKGFIKENFFDLVHVQDTAVINLKKEILYDGASNMRGEWNSLQAFASFKCHDQLQATQAIEIANMLDFDELETSKGHNQIGTVKRAGETQNIIKSVKEIMGIIDIILNAMYLVSSTKTFIQKLREDAFCEKHNIRVLDMDSPYVVKRGRHQHVDFNMEHHSRVKIFNAVIDSQLFELNSRFKERKIDLLTLSSALDLKDAYKSFNMDDICCIKEKQNVPNHPKLQNLSTIFYLCQRAFSTMKVVKIRLRNKIEDEFLINNLVVYIERHIVETFDSDSIFTDRISLKEHRAQF
ncbi:hypothetical protein V6Z11_D04G089300 [Gossypium hirsutum]